MEESARGSAGEDGNFSFVFSRTLTRDADEQAENLRRWDQTYEQLTPGRFLGCVTEVWLDGLQLFRETTNQCIHEGGRSWPGSRTFGVPLEMSGPASYRGKPMRRDALLTLDGDDELDFRTSRQLDIVGISVPSGHLASFVRQVDDLEIDRVLAGRYLIPVDLARAEAMRTRLREVFETCETTPHLFRHPESRRALVQSLLCEILGALAGGSGEPSESRTYSGRKRLVNRAREYVLTHLDGPVTVADLCGALGVSRRTLQYCFQDVVDTNPVQYLRSVRLSGARRDLKEADPDRDDVQDIAARWGFWHLSHFAADYKRMFGERPSDTLGRRAAAD